MRGKLFNMQLVSQFNVFVERLLKNAKIARLLGIFNLNYHTRKIKSKIVASLRTLFP